MRLSYNPLFKKNKLFDKLIIFLTISLINFLNFLIFILQQVILFILGSFLIKDISNLILFLLDYFFQMKR
jgi:hypothetical protein